MVTRLVEGESEEAKNRKSDEDQSTRAKHAPPSPVSRRRHHLGKSTRLHLKRQDITSSDGELAKVLIDGVGVRGAAVVCWGISPE